MFNLYPTINYNLNVSLLLLKKELKFIITHFFQKISGSSSHSCCHLSSYPSSSSQPLSSISTINQTPRQQLQLLLHLQLSGLLFTYPSRSNQNKTKQKK